LPTSVSGSSVAGARSTIYDRCSPALNPLVSRIA
jgi:hypothetical protein